MKTQTAPDLSRTPHPVKAEPPTPVIIKSGGGGNATSTPADTNVLIQTGVVFNDATGLKWEMAEASVPGNIIQVVISDGITTFYNETFSPGAELISVTLFYGNAQLVMAEQVDAETGETSMYLNSPEVPFNVLMHWSGQGWVDSGSSFTGSLTNIIVMQGSVQLENFSAADNPNIIVTVYYNLT